MAVFLAALHELALEVVHLVDELLTHGLAQRVALAAGKVCQQTRQQHHLLLVDGDAVGVLEVLVHLGDIVDDGALAVLALDKVGDVVHGARTVEGVHGYEVLEGGGLQLAQVFLHARRLELEGSDGTSLAVKLIRLGVVDGNFLQVDIDAAGAPNVRHGLLED